MGLGWGEEEGSVDGEREVGRAKASSWGDGGVSRGAGSGRGRQGVGGAGERQRAGLGSGCGLTASGRGRVGQWAGRAVAGISPPVWSLVVPSLC